MKKTVSGIMLTLLLIGCASFVASSSLSILYVYGADAVCELDLFSQLGGIGINASSPPFETGERIILFAHVTFNQAPMAQVLVAFEVDNPEDIPILVSIAATNSSGYATMNFTIAREMYPSYPSLWKAYATSSPAQETVQEIMPFYVTSLAAKVTILGDINGDGRVAGGDLNQLGLNWGLIGSQILNPNADINGDGKVGGADLNALGLHWGLHIKSEHQYNFSHTLKFNLPLTGIHNE